MPRRKAPPDPRPVLFLDVDGVISLFGFDFHRELPGEFHFVDGIAHCIGRRCGARIARLRDAFEIVWATGWEEKANEYLPHLLELPDLRLPVLTFDGAAVFGMAHWKVTAIEAYAGDRAMAWVDDSLDAACEEWAAAREAPTLLVKTESAVGITDEQVERLLEWSAAVNLAPS